jgi:hypothetical protein
VFARPIIAKVVAAKREAMADGKADLDTLQSMLEKWRLMRLHDVLVDKLGAVTPQDLLDLEEEEYHLVGLRPLEKKRFLQMMHALVLEFEMPPPGEEWTEVSEWFGDCQ